MFAGVLAVIDFNCKIWVQDLKVIKWLLKVFIQRLVSRTGSVIGGAAAGIGPLKIVGLVPDGGTEGQERVIGRARRGDRPDGYTRSVIERCFGGHTIGGDEKLRLLQNTLGYFRRISRG